MRVVSPVLGSALVLIACAPSSSGGGAPSVGDASSGGGQALGQSEQGVATYYAATGDGACSFGPSPSDLNVAAMNEAEWNGSGVCGECVAVTGPNGGVTVRIVDECPDCEAGQLDLSQEAFAQIADVSAGRVAVAWEVVACDVTGNIAYEVKAGSSQYWTAILVANSRLSITKLEWMQNGTWTDVPRADYNYFIVASGVGAGAYQVRVTAIDGEMLVDSLPPVQPSTTVQGSGQFQ
jgi:expansin